MRKPYPDRTREAVAERREQVRRLTLFGYSAREIAVQLGIDRINVIRHRKVLGIAATPAPPLTIVQEEVARGLVEDGASIKEVARTVGCSEWAIRHRYPEAAWTHKQRTDHMVTLAKLDPDRAEHHVRWWGYRALRMVSSSVQDPTHPASGQPKIWAPPTLWEETA